MSVSRPASFRPLDSRDGVPGNADGVAAAARRYQSTADEIAAQVANLKKLSDQSTEAWKGQAGDKFSGKAADLAGRIAKAEKRYQAAGDALRYFADHLEEIQERAYTAVLKAQEAESSMAEHATAIAVPLPPLPGAPAPTPAEASKAEAAAGAERQRQATVSAARSDLRAAETAYQNAKDDYDDLARRAAGRLSERGDDGLTDSWWDKHADTIKSILKVVAIVIVVLAVAALVLSLFIPGLNVLVGGVALAALLNGVATGLTVVSLGLHVGLAATDNGEWSDVAWALVGLATFGLGLAAGKAVKALGRPLTRLVSRGAGNAAGRSSLRASGIPGRLYTAGGSLRRSAVSMTRGGREAYGRADDLALAARNRIRQLDPPADFGHRLLANGDVGMARELARITAVAETAPGSLRAVVLAGAAQSVGVGTTAVSFVPAVPVAVKQVWDDQVTEPRQEQRVSDSVDRISGQWSNPLSSVR